VNNDGEMTDIELSISHVEDSIYGDNGKLNELSDEDFDALNTFSNNLQIDLAIYDRDR
jgi:hypothetical protein